MLSYLDFLDTFPTATPEQHAFTMEMMALGSITTPIRAAAFLSILPDLTNVDEAAFIWTAKHLNEEADNGDRVAIMRVFKPQNDAVHMLHRLRTYCRILGAWQ